MRNIGLVATALVIGCFGFSQLSSVSAFGSYRSQLVTQFKLVDARVGCQYCHVDAGGGAPWNAFGQRVQNNLSGNIAKALYDSLADKADSDGDGYTDMLEVFAGSLPGNKDSAPLVAVKTLEVAFEKAGGLEQYKP